MPRVPLPDHTGAMINAGHFKRLLHAQLKGAVVSPFGRETSPGLREQAWVMGQTMKG